MTKSDLSQVITPLGSSNPSATSRSGWVLSIALPLMAGFAAAAFGAVEAWSELALLCVSLPIAIFAAWELSRGGIGKLASIVMLLVAAYAALAVIQLVLLPTEALRFLSPERYGTLGELLPALPEYSTISYYPVDTVQSLRLLFVACAVFAAAITLARSFMHTRALLIGLFGIGGAQACLAIAQQATNAAGIYWSEEISGQVRSGSFVNHSNFAQFLNLTIGASLGLFLIRLSHDRKHGVHTDRRRSVSELFRRHGWLLIGIALQVVAIAASLSRAGLIGMVLAGIATTWLLRRSTVVGKSTWLLVVVPLLAFALLMPIGFDAVYHRIDTLQGESSYSDRVELGLNTLSVGWDHLIFGTGLGTHSWVFPSYDQTGSVAAAEQADNDYAQVFEESGLIGLLLLGSLIAALGVAVDRVTRMRHVTAAHAGYGVMYGLVAVGVQSLTDFGQRVPAVFCVSAALAGIVVGLASRRGEPSMPIRSMRSRLFIASAAGLVVLAGCGSLLRSGLADYRASQWWAVAYGLSESVKFDGFDADPQDYVDLIAATEMATEAQPKRIKYAFWLNAYRWEAMQFAAQGEDPLASPGGKQNVMLIADRLSEARALCPTHGPSHTLEGQLRLAAGDPSGAGLIERGVRLTPNDPVCCLAAALLTLSQPPSSAKDHEAYQLLARAIRLEPRFFREAIEAILEARGDLPAAVGLASTDPKRLRELARVIEASGELSDQAPGVRAKALAAQEKRVANGLAPADEVADLALRFSRADRLEESVRLYRQALAIQFNRHKWRYELIDALTKHGDHEAALREARIAVRLQPNNRKAMLTLETLIDQVELRSNAPSEE